MGLDPDIDAVVTTALASDGLMRPVSHADYCTHVVWRLCGLVKRTGPADDTAKGRQAMMSWGMRTYLYGFQNAMKRHHFKP